ncbi:MAG: acyltransferase [Chloroflexota bacterium]|nr:acyltransferase [Chloroflexota bacterium]
MAGGRTIPGDWHPGTIPDNVVLDAAALIETTYSFLPYRSEAAVGLQLGRGSGIYTGTMLDVGPRGRVRLGECALVTAVRIICDAEIEIGDYALLSWNVILMDTYRVPFDPDERRRVLEGVPIHAPRRIEAETAARPIRIGSNVWIGFDACVLPGVTIGEGAIVGARSVVVEDVAPYTIVAGNPARAIRRVDRESNGHGP